MACGLAFGPEVVPIRFNKVWFFWKELFYPIWNKLASEERKAVIANFIKLNYLCHFTSLHDVEYITNF